MLTRVVVVCARADPERAMPAAARMKLPRAMQALMTTSHVEETRRRIYRRVGASCGEGFVSDCDILDSPIEASGRVLATVRGGADAAELDRFHPALLPVLVP